MKKIIKQILLIVLFIIFFNINMSISNAAFPITDTYDIPMNLTIYNSTSNIWCIYDGAKLGQYHECLYKVTGSGTLDSNDEAQAALAKALYDNRTVTSKYNISAKQTGEIEGAIQQLAKKAGIGEKASSNGSNKANEYTDFGKLISILKNIDGKTIETNASKGDKSYYLSEAIDKFQGYYNQDIKCEVTSVTGTNEAWIVESTGAQQIQIINKDKQAFYVRFNDATEDTVKLKVKVTVDKMPKTTKYKIIRPQECNGMCSKNHTANYSKIWRNYIDTSNFEVVGTSGKDGWVSENKNAFYYNGNLYAVSVLDDNRVHNCAEHKLLKNFLTDYSLNEQPLMIVDFEEGSLEFEFEIIIKLEDTPTTTITVMKNWTGSLYNGNTYPNITVTLYNANDGSQVTKDADGNSIENPVTLTSGKLTYKWENLPKEDENGKTIKYKVEESETSGTIGSGDTAQEWNAEQSSATGTSGTLTLKNKVEPPPTPTPSPTPTPTPSDDEDVKITKTVEYVLSEYEGDTSSQDGAGNGSKEARVQTGDQVVFKIVVESLRKDEPEDTEKGEAGNWEDNEESTYGISGKPKEGNIQYCNISCHEGENRTSWEEYAYKDSGNCAECGNPLGVRQVKSYGFKSLKLEDVLEDESKVKIKSIFDGTYDHGSVNGFTKPEGTWSMSGNTFTWDSGIGEEESGKKSATLYILCDVSEDWKYDDGKGNECVNTATLKHVDWRITKTRWYHWQQETTPFTSNHVQTNPHYHYKYVTCTTCRGSGSVSTWQTCQYCNGLGYIRYGNDIYTCWQCGGRGGSNSSQTCSNCGGSGQVRVIERTDTLCKGESAKKGSTTKKCNKTSLPTKYEDEGKDYDISDTAKVILQGYKEAVEKKLTKIQSKYETEITGDDLKDELVQIGDVLTYTIRIKNEGETNIYTEFELEDELIDGLDTDDSKVDNSIWNGSDPTYTTTSVDGKNDSVQNGGRYIGNGEESEDVLFMAHVIGKPGERTENHVQLNYFHNRNKVKIESDAEATAENDIDTYSISVNKYITKVQSRQENSVAGSDGSGLVDLGDSRKTNKGEAVIVDRGDIVTFKIEITDDHDNTNIWKVVLKDVYNPEELALKEYRSEDNLFEVNGSGGNIELIYNNNPKDEPNTNNPHLEAGGGVRSVELDFVAIEGAEILKKDDIYENKVNIEEAYNRNHIEILKYSSTGGTHESSDKCKVRQINAVIDKYVSKVYGGIEDVVYSSESRKRESDTLDVYTINEKYKENNNVLVERGDEITFTVKVRNTGEGIITEMTLKDTFSTELKFKKEDVPEGWEVTNSGNELEVKYNKLFKPGEEYTLKFIFYLTEENEDEKTYYDGIYFNKIETIEIKNINSWTWNNNGGPNEPYTSVIDDYYKDQCYLNLLQNGFDGIPSNMWSSDYVYMLSYQVELDKYIINVKHTNDDGSESVYDKNIWRKNDGKGKETQDDDDTDREFLNNFKEDYKEGYDYYEKEDYDYYEKEEKAKGSYKETYPVQVEKNDIVTYEIKIKNTGERTSIYSLDLVDVFSAEDGIDINGAKNGTANVGIELLEGETNSENNGQIEIVKKDSNTYLFKFTPKQCSNNGKDLAEKGYGIGSGEEATFRIVVKVTRSNMYLYELRNTAVITNVYNRNNNIENYTYELTNTGNYIYKPTDTGNYTYNSTDTGRTVTDAYRVTNGNRAYIDIENNFVEPLTLNGLEYVYGNRTEEIKKNEKIPGIYLNTEEISNGNDKKHIIRVGNKIADADYINLKDLIISGYVWDDTDPNNEEDGLMTWGLQDSTDAKVDGDVTVYLYRVHPDDTEDTKGKLVMSTTVAEDGYYIFDNNSVVYSEANKPDLFEKKNADKKFYDDRNSITVEQKYRFEPTTYIRPTIQVNTEVIKGQQEDENTKEKKAITKTIYNGFTNYRIVKAPNKDYKEGTARYKYDSDETKYYQYYVEFEYNGMKYTHTVYGSDSVLDGAKGKAGDTSNQDGQYNLITNGRATRLSENWLPYRTSTKDNSEYYEIDSNAAEFKSVREAFNNQFSEIAYNRGLDKNNNETSIKYNEEQNKHIDRYDEAQDNVKIRARSFITKWIDKVGPEINNDDSAKTYRNDLYKKFSATIGDYTNTLFFWDSKNKTRSYKNTVGTTEETEYLKYINLGLKRRPEFDMELVKDVYNVQVDINDKTMVYDYNCIIPLDRADETDDTSKYFTEGYELNLYKSDYYYRYEDYSNTTVQKYKKGIEPENSELNTEDQTEIDWLNSLGFNLDNEKSESELNIQITYRYRITNTSKDKTKNGNELIIGTVNEIIDYHSADLIPNKTGRYEKIRANKNKQQYSNDTEDSGELSVSTVYKKAGYRTVNENNVYADQDNKKQEKINAVYLTGLENVWLYPSDSVDIYLTFTVSRNSTSFKKLVNSENKEKEAMQLGIKNNVAEISAFSTKYDIDEITNWSKELDTPGLVDKDSNPGDLELKDIDNYKVYNDDTYKVDITTKLYNDDDGNNDGERLIDGLVWEDVKINEKGVYYLNNPAKIIYQTMQVVADGKYDLGMTSKDKFIQNLKVELVELINVNGIVYEDRAEVIVSSGENSVSIDNKELKERLLSTKTNASGKYTISGFIPGNYVVRFTYGDTCDTVDQGYNGQDYKSTSYQVDIDNKDNTGYIANIWHDLLSQDVNKVEPNNKYKNEYDEDSLEFNIAKKNDDAGANVHISDARDDEVRRLEVSAYSRTINNKVAEVLNSAIADGHSTGLHDELRKNTWMFADTAKLQIEVEHINNTKEYTKQKIKSSKYNKDTNSYYENLYYEIEAQAKKVVGKDENNNETRIIKNKKIPYYIGNIDFGLEARPTTNISLTKLVSGIRVETADGEEILDVEYEPQYSEDGTLLLNGNGVPKVDNTVTTGAEHMQALNSSTTDMWDKENMKNDEKTPDALKQIYRNLKTTQGFYYINIDEDLMQGAVITLRYSIVVANESEVDTLGLLTGFKNGEQIYDEVVAILGNDESKSTYKFNNESLSKYYKYVDAKAISEIPEYGKPLKNDETLENDEKIYEITGNNIGDLKYGYYTGATYYTGDYHKDTYVVETRIDQIIDYVDNNLNVREEDNSTKDSSWRTVSLKELVEGEIQKDVVGQNWTENTDYKTLNNTYSKTLSVIVSENEEPLKYVPYEYASKNESKKLISVNNVGNMLSDKVYRKVFEENVEDKDLENELKNASVTVPLTVNNDKIEDKTGKSVTILDSNAREYITEQRNNILLSIPEADKNPDLYKYLIPAKALTAKPNGRDVPVTFNQLNMDSIVNNLDEKVIEIYNVYKNERRNPKYTLEDVINFANVYYDDEVLENDEKAKQANEYRIAKDKLIEEVKKAIEDQIKDYVYGTQNGSEPNYDKDNKEYNKINGDTSAKIKITATRTISPESTAEEREDLTFENLAEILQFSNEAGRRDEFATVGDAQVWEGAWKASTGYTPQGGTTGDTDGSTDNNDEETKTKTKERYDTDTTEMVLLSPPTGLSQRELVELGTVKTQNNILLISVLTLTMLGTIIVVIKISNRTKFYR